MKSSGIIKALPPNAYWLFILLFLLCCGPVPVTEKQMKAAMNKVDFDQRIISDLSRYEKLRAFLETHKDTIINYRYSKNKVLLRRPGNKDSAYLSDDDCYVFFEGNDHVNISNVPRYLKKELHSLFHSFSEKEIQSFEVCKDNQVSIEVRSEDREERMHISHNLLWNTKIERDWQYDMNKDTMLNNGCIYRIGLTVDYGR